VFKQGHSAKKLFKKNKKTLPSAWAGALGKVIFLKKIKKNFAECLGRGTRQSNFF